MSSLTFKFKRSTCKTVLVTGKQSTCTYKHVPTNMIWVHVILYYNVCCNSISTGSWMGYMKYWNQQQTALLKTCTVSWQKKLSLICYKRKIITLLSDLKVSKIFGSWENKC